MLQQAPDFLPINHPFRDAGNDFSSTPLGHKNKTVLITDARPSVHFLIVCNVVIDS